MAERALKLPLSRPLPEWAKRRPKRGSGNEIEQKQPLMKSTLPPLVPPISHVPSMDANGFRTGRGKASVGGAGLLAEGSIWRMPLDVKAVRASATRELRLSESSRNDTKVPSVHEVRAAILPGSEVAHSKQQDKIGLALQLLAESDPLRRTLL